MNLVREPLGYDLANRLDWARMDYEQNGSQKASDIDYVYDRYGNMTDRLVTDDVPALAKEYVRGAGGLLAINSACGPRPDLAYGNPRKEGTQYKFHKYDHIAPSGEYRIFIESESGLTKTLTRPSTLSDEFGIEESEFFPGENNRISIETTAECGTTGYSNALSIRRGAGGGGCLNLASLFLYLQRTGFGDDGSSTQEIGTSDNGSGCPPGTLFNAYYQPAGSTTIYRLYQQPQSIPNILLPNQPAGAGHGQYWFTAVDPATMQEFDQSPVILDDARNTTQNQNPASAPASRNLQYVHRDHLGSTRLMTDENGTEIGRWKYFPFGTEATVEESGDRRMKFTGHERDGEVELDYMSSRSYSATTGRFTSVDSLSSSAAPDRPRSWNRYAYVTNGPIGRLDPDGLDEIEFGDQTVTVFTGEVLVLENSHGGIHTATYRSTGDAGEVFVYDSTFERNTGAVPDSGLHPGARYQGRTHSAHDLKASEDWSPSEAQVVGVVPVEGASTGVPVSDLDNGATISSVQMLWRGGSDGHLQCTDHTQALAAASGYELVDISSGASTTEFENAAVVSSVNSQVSE